MQTLRVKRVLQGAHLIQNHAETPYVRLEVVGQVLDLDEVSNHWLIVIRSYPLVQYPRYKER